MKKLLILTAFLSLTACGRDVATFEGPEENVFVVRSIKHMNGLFDADFDKNLCVYTTGHTNGTLRGFSIYEAPASIVCPCGLYQIEDTIKLARK